MKVFKKIYTIFAASACAFLLLNGCSAITNGLSSAEAADFSVSGEISCSGASPRAATSALKDDITWKISAKKSDDSESVEPITAKNMTFTLNLPSAGKWKILAEGSSGETKILSGEKEVTVDVKGLTGINISVAVSLDFSKLADFDAVTGSVELPVTDKTGKIAKVSGNLTYVLYDVEPVEEDSGEEVSEEYYEKLEELMKPKSFSATFSNGTASIKLSDLTPGLYDAKIQFLDSAGNALYSCMEQFTVYSGFTTDTWYGTAPYLSDGKFELTSALLGTFASYIVPSTKYALYNFDSTNYTYNFYLKDSANANISGEADFSTSNNSFTFDKDGYIYWLESESNRYSIKSNKSSDFSISIEYNYDSMPSITIDRVTHKLYFYYFNDQTLDINEYDISGTGTPTSTSGTYSINFSDYYGSQIIINDGIVYEIANFNDEGTHYQRLLQVLLSDTSSKTDLITDIYGLLNLQSDSYGSYHATITDMLYQDGCVYILIKEKYFEQNSGLETNFAMNCRGAVIRYDTISKDLDSCGWTDSSNGTTFKVASAVSSNEKYYLSDSNGQLISRTSDAADWILVSAKTELKFSDGFGNNNTITVNVPAASSKSSAFSNSAFYGPQKFVALKPKKLVIADSGIAFYTDDNNIWRYKNLNRIVTVDLDNFVIEPESASSYSGRLGDKVTSALVKLGGSSYGAMLSDDYSVTATLYETNASFTNPSGSYWEISASEAKNKVYAGLLRDDD